jgi:transmembrane sensor
MNQDKETLSGLIHKYLENQISPEEYQELWRLLNEHPNEEPLDQQLNQLWQTARNETPLIEASRWDNNMQIGMQKLNEHPAQEKAKLYPISFNKRYRWVAAAAIFLFLASSVLFLKYRNNADVYTSNKKSAINQDRLPGTNKAVLTLSDGRTIILDSAGNGMLAQQGKTSIIKKNDGQLVYNPGAAQSNEVVYNLLQTPRGGQYKITLPDGSKVWLNASSSLRYPVIFAGKDRRVEITGEAYFEVAKDASRPFRVQLNNMEVEVLGTHFNINGYADEDAVRTTLLEGKVKVLVSDQSKYLQPGQQAQLKTSGKIAIVDDVNLDETVAWKDGNFQFENSDIKAVMRQLARWYDVEVSYEGTVNKHFIGNISRDVKLSQVLSMLQQTGEVKFKIEGNKLFVMP